MITDAGRAQAEAGVPELRIRAAIDILEGDAFTGRPGESFDCIHVGAAAPRLPRNLVEQLAPGGRMVVPVGTSAQELVVVDKPADGGEVAVSSVMGVRYVPLTSRAEQLGRRVR